MKIKRNYEKIVDELLKIQKYIIVDLIVSIYDLNALRKDFSQFFNAEINHENMIQVISELAQVIQSKHKQALPVVFEAVIKRNKAYIEYAGYQKFSLDRLKEIFKEEKTPSLHGEGLTPEMMVLYFYAENRFNHPWMPELIEQCHIYHELAEQARKRYTENQPEIVEQGLPDITEIERTLYEAEDLKGIDKADWQDIAKRFGCEYDETTQKYNKVKRGLLLFYDVNIKILKEAKLHYDFISGAVRAFARKLYLSAEGLKRIWKYCNNIAEENRKLKTEVKSLRKQLNELDAKYRAISKASPDSKEKQLAGLLKENYYLKTRIEKLEQFVEELQKAQEINKEITDNIEIPQEEAKVEKKIHLPEYQTIVIVGGRWNSREKEQLQTALNTCDIKFIEAEKTISKIDTIKNAEIVIFDTSRNAHKYFYLVKEQAKDLFIIGKSSAEAVLEIFNKNC